MNRFIGIEVKVIQSLFDPRPRCNLLQNKIEKYLEFFSFNKKKSIIMSAHVASDTKINKLLKRTDFFSRIYL